MEAQGLAGRAAPAGEEAGGDSVRCVRRRQSGWRVREGLAGVPPATPPARSGATVVGLLCIPERSSVGRYHHVFELSAFELML